MKYLIITLITTILTLTACDSRTGLNKAKKAPELEMIFGKEKKALESYMNFVDSLKASSNLPVDTTLFKKGSYLLEDSLEESNNVSAMIDMIERATAENAGKPIQVMMFNDLDRVLDGNVKYESYESYLNELKKINYLVVVKNVILTNPALFSNKKFQGGMIISMVQVIDLQKKIIVKNRVLSAESSSTVETSTTYGMSQSDIEEDFWKNYRTNRSVLLNNLFN